MEKIVTNNTNSVNTTNTANNANNPNSGNIVNMVNTVNNNLQLYDADVVKYSDYSNYSNYSNGSSKNVGDVLQKLNSSGLLPKKIVKKSILYTETIDTYNKVTKPLIYKSDKKWIHDIIDDYKEHDKIVFETNEFVVLPDTSWTSSDIEDLYLLLIIKRKDLASIRDLTAEHIPLLENMLEISAIEIEKQYKIPACMLRMYFHYKPSTWHLHLHINNINSTKHYSYGVERCHSLINVINNLKIDTNYYKKVDLQVVKYI